jgi:hypothetical protein
MRLWKSKGVNLNDPEELQAYAKEQDLKGLGAARNRALKRMTKTPSPTPTSGGTVEHTSFANLPSAYDEGAAAALKRLQGFEADHARRLGVALANGDELQIRTASEDHARCAQVLLKYEKEVTEAKRDLGHLIPKSEAIKGARSAAIWFRLAWRLWLSSSLPDVVARATGQSMRDALYLCEISFAEILALEIRNSKDSRDEVVPDWAEQQILESWHVNP